MSSEKRESKPAMREDIALVRQHLQKIDGISATWLEWEFEEDTFVKTLVVQVDFDTDPNSPEFRQNVLDAIESTTLAVMEDTTMVISRLRVVPKIPR